MSGLLFITVERNPETGRFYPVGSWLETRVEGPEQPTPCDILLTHTDALLGKSVIDWLVDLPDADRVAVTHALAEHAV